MFSNGWVLARKRYWWNNLNSKFPEAAESFLQQAGLTRQYVEDTLNMKNAKANQGEVSGSRSPPTELLQMLNPKSEKPLN